MPPLSEYLFDSPIERRILALYRRIFSIQEIEENHILQWVFGATILSYFATFIEWVGNRITTLDAVADGSYRCWSYFQDCAKLYFLRALPEGYSQTSLYMVLFALMLLCVYLIYRKEWVLAHLVLVPSFLWHGFACFFLTGALSGNYDYYLVILAGVLLFFPHKEFFLKLAFVFFYVLSSASKIHPAWVLGTYFSAMKTGLPFFPDWSIPLWSNLVIFMEMIGAWFLLSPYKILQRLVFAFFVTFHLYSGLLVQFHYPAVVLPTLLILFGPFYRYTPPPLEKKAIAGWLLILGMFVAQMTPLLIPGDEKLTMEGNKFGLYMFESNHQCISTTRIYYADGSVKDRKRESESARSRCDPYQYWFALRERCTRSEKRIERIEWTFDHSINGGPFLRIVEVKDACALSYDPWAHNAWINIENPRPIGYPVENVYE